MLHVLNYLLHKFTACLAINNKYNVIILMLFQKIKVIGGGGEATQTFSW